MQPQILVVSDPPHGDVDIGAVSDTLGLDADDARLKIAFPAPEIVAAADPARAEKIARSLGDAGLRVRVVDGYALAEVPWPTPVSTLELGPSSLVATARGQEVEIPFEAGVMGVHFRPPNDFPREPRTSLDEASRREGGPAVADALEWAPHLDLLFGRSGATERLVIVRDPDEIAAECERRFERIDLDRRLENIRPRRRFIAGEADFDMDLRKAFSFGTLLLRQILESISPELRDIPQHEFASRLSYVIRGYVGSPG